MSASAFDRATARAEWLELAPEVAEATAAASSDVRRAALEASMKEFLARGGAIRVCAPGETGLSDEEIANADVSGVGFRYGAREYVDAAVFWD